MLGSEQTCGIVFSFNFLLSGHVDYRPDAELAPYDILLSGPGIALAAMYFLTRSSCDLF